MADHDQRFKILLHEFFADFFQLFFPKWAERFDFASLEWLDKEAFADPPQGERRFLDVIAKVRTKQPITTPHGSEAESWVALIHVEIESADTVMPLRKRMADYYMLLRQRHRLPVLPIGLYLQVGLDGIGFDAYEERFWELTVLRFEYLYVGLPALLAEEYVQSDNSLAVGLSALMRLSPERRGWLAAQALQRIKALPNSDWRRFLLGELVMAYLPLEGEQQLEFERLLNTAPYRKAKEMENTMLSHWRKEFLDKGREEGRREALSDLLEQRFGPLETRVRDRLNALPMEQVLDLFKKGLQASSLQELGLTEETN